MQAPDVTEPPLFVAGEHTWPLKFTVGNLDAVYETTQIHLIPQRENDQSPLPGMLLNHKLLADVLWELVAKRAAAQSPPLTRDDFDELLDEDALQSGWAALCDATVFFVRRRSPEMAAALEAAIEAEVGMLAAGAKQMTATLTSPATQTMLDETTQKMAAKLQSGLASQCDNFVSNWEPLPGSPTPGSSAGAS